jgi:hypothetical protein
MEGGNGMSGKIRKTAGGYDEVLCRTEDGGLLWKRYGPGGALVKKQKYRGFTVKQVRQMYPNAMYIKDIPVR